MKMQYVSYRDNHILFEKNDIADAYYLIASGQVELFDSQKSRNGREVKFKEEKIVDTLYPGMGFGERGVLNNIPRALSARIKGDAELIKI